MIVVKFAGKYISFNKGFNAIDPMLEFASPYSHVGNNPVSFTDPTGMGWRWVFICSYIDHGEDSDTYGWLIEVWREVWFPDDFYNYWGGSSGGSGDSSGSGGVGGTEVIKYGSGGGDSSNSNSNWDIVKDNYYELEIFDDQTLNISIVNLNPIPLNLNIEVVSTVDQSITIELSPLRTYPLEFYCLGKTPVYWKLIFSSSDNALIYFLMW